MPQGGRRSITELQAVFAAGGEQAVRAYYPDETFFLLILSDDGIRTHLSWAPNSDDTEEFEITHLTPPDPTLGSRILKTPPGGRGGGIEPNSMVVPLMPEQDEVSIGRGGFNDVKLVESDVSAIHANFVAFYVGDKKGWSIVDKGSKNGTLMDGIMLDVGRPYTLTPYRHIEFGRVKCIFLDVDGLLDVCES